MIRRWRPSLRLVLGGALAGTLALAFFGMIALRYLGPEIGFRNAAGGLASLIALATVGLGWLLVRLLLRPIRDLERFAAAQERGDRVDTPQHFGTRELHATAQRVITMADALRNREASVRAFSDHVTHELRTPVAAIRAGVELLADSPGLPPEERHLLAQIDSAWQQLESQLTALRDAARAREARFLGQTTLADVLPALRADWPDIQLQATGADLAIPLAREGLYIALGHLLRNAAENAADTVTLNVVANDTECCLSVQDNGQGIAVGNASRIFDPFFTTRRESGGTGMGLTVVRNILRAHQADILLTDHGRGAMFLLSFATATQKRK